MPNPCRESGSGSSDDGSTPSAGDHDHDHDHDPDSEPSYYCSDDGGDDSDQLWEVVDDHWWEANDGHHFSTDDDPEWHVWGWEVGLFQMDYFDTENWFEAIWDYVAYENDDYGVGCFGIMSRVGDTCPFYGRSRRRHVWIAIKPKNGAITTHRVGLSGGQREEPPE